MSEYDHYETRDPFLKEDGFDVTRWMRYPPHEAKRQLDLLIAHVEGKGWKKEPPFVWAPNRTVRLIEGFPAWGPWPPRPPSIQAYLALVRDSQSAWKRANPSNDRRKAKMDDLDSLGTALQTVIDREGW